MSARDELFNWLVNGDTPWTDTVETANHLLDAYHADVLREAADVADRLALEFREGDDEWSSREVRDAVQEVAGTLRSMAEGGKK